jgi:2-haloacid dehalogenase
MLKGAGIRMAFLSNFTADMLDAAMRNSGLEGIFEPHLSTDLVKAFKPDPRAYRMGVDAFGVAKEEILFAAFAGWDAAGAKRFGYPTFWVNRANAPLEELGIAPDGTGAGLQDLVAFVGA